MAFNIFAAMGLFGRFFFLMAKKLVQLSMS